MATMSLQVHYRPLRIGFLVRAGSIADLVCAARINTALWGGIYNPMIPVGSTPDLPDRLIRLFGVDVLYPVSDDSSLTEVFSRHSWLAWPHSFQKPDLFEGNERQCLTVLDVIPIITHHWEREFRHHEKKSNCVLISWDPTDPLNTLFTLQFGQYPDIKYKYADAFEKGMNANILTIGFDPLPEELAKQVPPIELTRDRLIPTFYHYWQRNGVYIGIPDDFQDFVNFWNLRAAGINLLFWPLNSEERLRGYVTANLFDMWSLIQKSAGYERDICIWSARQNMDSDNVKKRAASVQPQDASLIYCNVDEVTWNGFNVKPPTYKFETQTVLANVDEHQNGPPYITLALPRKPFSESLPRESERQQWIIEVHPLTEYAYEGYTLRPPNIPDLNEWYGFCCVFDRRSLRVQAEGLGVIIRLHSETLHLIPVCNKDLIVRILEHVGISAKPSQPGRIAERLLHQMGGLEGCRVFKIPGVRKLIESQEARKGLTRGRATEIIYDKGNSGPGSFKRHNNLFIERREKSNLGTHDVFDFLLKKNIFRAGLLLACPNCTLDFWLSVDSLREHCTCQFCGHQFLLSLQVKDRGDWRFRLSGLFGRGDHQEGAIPVTLTLLQLLRRDPGGQTFLYSTALELKGNSINCESDLVVVESKRDGNIALLLGECKTNLEISHDDIENLLKAKEAIHKAGLDCFLIFAKTSSEFTEAEISQFKELHKNDIPVILFTAKELEPYDPYGNDPEDEILPHTYVFSFEEMAENSVHRYLKTAESSSGAST